MWTPLPFSALRIRGQRGDERLAFAGDHFGDVAAVQHDAAEDLHVEVPHVLGALGGLAAGGERFGQQVVERSPFASRSRNFGAVGLEFRVGHGLHRRFEFVDLGQQRAGNDRVRVYRGPSR